MDEGIIIGGAGGQGALFIGRLLAEAGMLEGREVVWLPSYGAEKRGGTVWCHVTIAAEPIGELFVTKPMAAIAMNAAALTRLEPMMKSGGLLVVNQSLASARVRREDIGAIYVPATEMALELSDESVANLVALGAFIAARTVVKMASINTAMDNLLGKSSRLEMNRKALKRGFAFAQDSRVESAVKLR